jgi:hypothetical protein
MIDWDKLIEERNVWVERNFPNARTPLDSFLGCIEELGELTHAELKMSQGIRGDHKAHIAAAQDAVGDLSVYLMGIMNWSKFTPGVYHDFPKPKNSDDCICKVLVNLGRIDRASEIGHHGLINRGIDSIVYYLEQFCLIKGWDYENIVQDTWHTVSQRDWINNAIDGSAA